MGPYESQTFRLFHSRGAGTFSVPFVLGGAGKGLQAEEEPRKELE